MEDKKLEKQLGLWDVYAISTGAMFSSGFFLLPGIAAAVTGPSVFLANFKAGWLDILFPGDMVIKENDKLSTIDEAEDIEQIRKWRATD